jgi:hypothetical protein
MTSTLKLNHYPSAMLNAIRAPAANTTRAAMKPMIPLMAEPRATQLRMHSQMQSRGRLGGSGASWGASRILFRSAPVAKAETRRSPVAHRRAAAKPKEQYRGFGQTQTAYPARAHAQMAQIQSPKCGQTQSPLTVAVCRTEHSNGRSAIWSVRHESGHVIVRLKSPFGRSKGLSRN